MLLITKKVTQIWSIQSNLVPLSKLKESSELFMEGNRAIGEKNGNRIEEYIGRVVYVEKCVNHGKCEIGYILSNGDFGGELVTVVNLRGKRMVNQQLLSFT